MGQISTKFRIFPPGIRNDFSLIGIENVYDFIGCFILNESELPNLIDGDVPLTTDDHPVLEFSSPESIYSMTTWDNFNWLLNYRKHPPLLTGVEAVKYSKMIQEHFDSMTHLFQGYISMRKGDTKEALGELEKSILITSSIEAKRTLSDLYDSMGEDSSAHQNYDQAIEDFKLAIKNNFGNPVFYNNLGAAYFNKNDLENAGESYQKAISINPGMTAARKNLESVAVRYYYQGAELARKGDYDHAWASYAQSVKFKPDFSPAYNDRGSICMIRGETLKARKEYETALKLDPQNTEIKKNYERCLSALK